MSENEQAQTRMERPAPPGISYDVRPEDCRAADRHARRRIMGKAVPSWTATLYTTIITLASFLSALFIYGVAVRRGGVESRLLFAALVLYVIVFFTASLWRRFVISRADRLVAANAGARCGQKQLTLDNGYLRLSSGVSETRVSLQAVRDVFVLEDIILLYLDDVSNIIVPRRAFKTPDEENEFIDLTQKNLQTAGRQFGTADALGVEAPRSPSDGQMPVPLGTGQNGAVSGGKSLHPVAALADGVLTNIRNGIRLAFFRRVAADSLRASPGAFAAMALFDLVLHFLLSVARIGPEGQFALYPLASALLHIPLMLFAGLCIARLARKRELVLALPVSWLSIGIPLDLMAAFFSWSLGNGTAANLEPYFQGYHFFALYGWWTLAALAATLRMTCAAGARRLGVTALLAALIIVPLWETQRGELWREAYDDSDEPDVSAAAGEDAFYKQPALLDDALANLRPDDNSAGNIYFVGFAGYGSQDVFRKELEAVRLLFQDRFDTAGHSLVMVNNPGTVLKYPIATATSLRLALNRVGKVMDRDRDILFLYLASHGSRDHRLSVDLWPLELREIDPAMLRRMLDESGIRWRVIVVSACYSGGFIEALKDEGTLVMTASDASSNSFGCSNDSDFTWFGEALFNEELRHTFSFTTAFQRASDSIRKREAREGEEPSNPQIYTGKDILPVLSWLETRLEKRERLRKRKLERADMAMCREQR